MNTSGPAWILAALMSSLLGGAVHAADAAWPRIDAGDWQFLSESENVRGYIKPVESVGHPRMWLRLEYREPAVGEDGEKTASALMLTQFHCAKRASRDLSMAGYPRNNLKGKGQTEYGGPEWEPVPADSALADMFRIACLDYVPQAPSVWTPMRMGVWELLEDEDHLKVFQSYESPLVYPRLWTRVEFRDGSDWNNRPFRSGQQLHEFDCTGERVRTIFDVRYPDHNLQGAPDMSAGYQAWNKPELGAPLHYLMQLACYRDAFAEADESGRYEFAATLRPLDRAFRYVDDSGWAAMAITRDVKFFVRGSNGGVYPRVEIRREYLKRQQVEDVKFRSIWTLVELDCLVGRQRNLRSIFYSKSNLKGDETVVETPDDWIAFEEAAEEYILLQSACHLGLDEDGDPIDPEGVTVPGREEEQP